MKRVATYWPPKSWEDSACVAMHIHSMWIVNGGVTEVLLDADVAEGGFLYDGITSATDPTILDGAREIAQFLTYPNLRSLKQVRKAILS